MSGGFFSDVISGVKGIVEKEVDRYKDVSSEKSTLAALLSDAGDSFPGSDYRPSDRKNWIAGIAPPEKILLHQIVFPGTHDSASNHIGVALITRPFAQCQDLSIYDQLAAGVRVLDVRVNQDRCVCHGILSSYSVDVVLDDVKRFLAETAGEVLILEIRTEFGHDDPPEFDAYLTEKLGDLLIHHDDGVFRSPLSALLPRRVICVWKPRKAAAPGPGGALWSGDCLRDDWKDTDLPDTKFEHNMELLGRQPAAAERSFFYRVENTLTPQADNSVVLVRPVTERIRPYARLFISQAFARGVADRLQVFSTDFVDEDFVDACAAVTNARVNGA